MAFKLFLSIASLTTVLAKSFFLRDIVDLCLTATASITQNPYADKAWHEARLPKRWMEDFLRFTFGVLPPRNFWAEMNWKGRERIVCQEAGAKPCPLLSISNERDKAIT